MAEEANITIEAVQISLETLLTTRDNSLRSEANTWLTQVFRTSEKAWDISMQLIVYPKDNFRPGIPSINDLQLFGAQILFQKLNDDIHQIFHDQHKTLNICQFILSQCFNSSNSTNKSLRLRMSECLSVALVSFIGAYWTSAFADIIAAGQQRVLGHESAVTLLPVECINRINLMHTLSNLPELISSIECKKHLMGLLGHHTYTNWRKTKAGMYILSQIPTVSLIVAETLRLALNSFSYPDVSLLSKELIHEACLLTTQWSRIFDSSILLASEKLSNNQLLYDLLLLDDSITKDPAVPEMFSVNIPRFNLPRWISSSETSNSFNTSNLFQLSSLGEPSRIIGPLLLFFHQRVLGPLLNICKNTGTVPNVDNLEANGGKDFLSFAYHWAIVLYNLAVVSPQLLLSQTTALQIDHVAFHEIPPNLLLQLLRAETRLHPQTHSQLLELWTDIMDLRNDHVLSNNHVQQILDQLGEVTLISLLSHSRRDHSVWDSNKNSHCCDPEGRGSYIEASQDAVVSLYYLYHGIEEGQSTSMVIQLTSIFEQCCETNDSAGAASCLILLEAITETVIDLSADHFTRVLVTICEKVPCDLECVVIIANMIKNQAVFLTEPIYAPLWTTFFDCLMRVFHVAPKICSDGIFELCDSGGNLGFQQVPCPGDLIRNFYMFIEMQIKALPGRSAEFEATLFGALATLIRRLPISEAPRVFVESLSATTSAVEITLPLISQNASGGQIEQSHHMNTIVLLLRRVSRSISSLESKMAEVSQSHMQEVRQTFVTQLLFGVSGDQTHWKTYCTTASILLERPVLDPGLQLSIPASDCYAKRKAEQYLWLTDITPLAAKNLGLHLLRQFTRATPVWTCDEFWSVLAHIVRHHFQLTTAINVDGSLYYALSDIANKLSSHYSEYSHLGITSTTQRFNELTSFKAWTEIIDTLAIPIFVSKAAEFQVAVWGTLMKPLFQLIESAINLWNISSLFNYQTVRSLMPALIKGLQCPSNKLQQFVFASLVKLLTTKNAELSGIVLEFYSDLVHNFWSYCHLWDFQRISRALSLVDALVWPSGDASAPQKFIHISRTAWDNRKHHCDHEGLFLIFKESHMNLALELFNVVRGIRVRQLLMDLIKIGKHAATPDCLFAYQFLLNRTASKPQLQSNVVDIE